MLVIKWLTVNESGAVRVTHKKPNLGADEISILINLSIPDELFEKPHLEASITIPDEVAARDTLSEDVVDSVRIAIEQKTGLEFKVSVVYQDEQE